MRLELLLMLAMLIAAFYYLSPGAVYDSYQKSNAYACSFDSKISCKVEGSLERAGVSKTEITYSLTSQDPAFQEWKHSQWYSKDPNRCRIIGYACYGNDECMAGRMPPQQTGTLTGEAWAERHYIGGTFSDITIHCKADGGIYSEDPFTRVEFYYEPTSISTTQPTTTTSPTTTATTTTIAPQPKPKTLFDLIIQKISSILTYLKSLIMW